MTSETRSNPITIPKWQTYLLLAASAMTGLLIILGGVVCVTTSGKGCPDWPGCYGHILPPLQMDAVIEFTHRLTAALTSPVILAAAIVGWWKARPIRWVSRPPILAIVFLAAVIVFGATAVLYGLPPLLAAADVGSALMVLALMLAATVVAFARRDRPTLPDRLSFRSPFAVLTLVTLAMVFLVLVSTVLVAGKGSLTRCLGWPLLVERLIRNDVPGWPSAARRFAAAAAGLLILAVAVQAWRTQRQHTALLRAATGASLLFLAEAGLQGLLLISDLTVWLLLISVTAATGLWAALVITAVLAGLDGAKTM